MSNNSAPGQPNDVDRSKLGTEIPHGNPHALSVSLPTWVDNVGWASGDDEVVSAMATGYPRFFIHRKILELGERCLEYLGDADRITILHSTARAAKECHDYLVRYAASTTPTPKMDVKSVYLTLDPSERAELGKPYLEVHLAIFPEELRRLGKSFWQHAGMGISSRYAIACLSSIEKYGILSEPPQVTEAIVPNPEHLRAKKALCERIAHLAAFGELPSSESQQSASQIVWDTKRKYPEGSDVFIYPSGMSAIWHAHHLTMALKPNVKAVCFGFPYTDTNKVLDRWGPGCVFYGHHPDDNLAAFESFLETNTGISALFCECPSNPLLQSPNLPRLRELANKHDFLIVIDDTIGNFVNVDALQFVDIVTTSLSKLFSGAADVLGGSLVLNPDMKHYHSLKELLSNSYRDDYFPPDVIKVEKNSRDFPSRVAKIDANAEIVCNYLCSRTISAQPTASENARKLAIKQIFYPTWSTRENYDLSRRRIPGRDNNFGCLFSLTFVSDAASEAFYNTLPCCKGPSLGTNFTLVCPYTILGHFRELEFAAGYGVEYGLVRVSVGMEDIDVLMGWVEAAVQAAEAVVA